MNATTDTAIHKTVARLHRAGGFITYNVETFWLRSTTKSQWEHEWHSGVGSVAQLRQNSDLWMTEYT